MWPTTHSGNQHIIISNDYMVVPLCGGPLWYYHKYILLCTTRHDRGHRIIVSYDYTVAPPCVVGHTSLKMRLCPWQDPRYQKNDTSNYLSQILIVKKSHMKKHFGYEPEKFDYTFKKNRASLRFPRLKLKRMSRWSRLGSTHQKLSLFTLNVRTCPPLKNTYSLSKKSRKIKIWSVPKMSKYEWLFDRIKCDEPNAG